MRNKNEVPLFGTGIYYFLPGFSVLIFLDYMSSSILLLANFIKDIPAPKRARPLRVMRLMPAERFDTSNGCESICDKHRLGTSGYLQGSACHVLDDESTRSILVATARQTMSTAMLQKLKLARRTHGTES